MELYTDMGLASCCKKCKKYVAEFCERQEKERVERFMRNIYHYRYKGKIIISYENLEKIYKTVWEE